MSFAVSFLQRNFDIFFPIVKPCGLAHALIVVHISLKLMKNLLVDRDVLEASNFSQNRPTIRTHNKALHNERNDTLGAVAVTALR
jgi:hypothetical protein